jgi:bifunctional DNA-binding transcriptional regulator/antitoxin component of YhaV-PrlF toxin-antitoxin module
MENLMATRMKVQKTPNNQYIVTIPRTLVEALGLRKGSVVKFYINDRNELVIRRAKK